jgi:hypothetical protein
MRSSLAALLILAAAPALAGASSTPFDYTPDPGLRTASRGELESRVRRACSVTQARLTSRAETELNRPCGCYASRTLRAFSPDELDAYRSTGVFNDTGRAKALASLDACGLRRPA